MVELDFSYYVWPQETELFIYPSPYDIYRKHCKEKSSKSPLHIDCNGSIWDVSQGHFKSTNFTKDSAVLFNLTKSLCSELYSWEKEYKVIEVCSYTLKDTRHFHHETVTVLREGNNVKPANANCEFMQIAVSNQCYSFLAAYDTLNNSSNNTNIRELCLILKLHSVSSINCTVEDDATWQVLQNRTYLILPEDFVDVSPDNQCRERQYTCDDQHCISDEYVNDGISDCPDGSDEVESNLLCPKASQQNDQKCELKEETPCTCRYDRYMCGGQCIPWNQVCDGKVDCMGGQDEVDCPLEVSNGTSVNSPIYFICDNGASIPHDLVDDFLPDCVHAEDELHLVQNSWSSVSCREAYHIPCVPGHPRCFPLHALCVYDLDHRGNVKYCRNGAHLAQCTYIGCPYKFKCPQSYCIPLTSLCNKVTDCPYGEDENKCDYSSPLICPGMFYCRGGHCLHQLQVCDGERDCPNGDDENNCDRQTPPDICNADGGLLQCKYSGQYPKIDLYKYRALIVSGHVQTLDNLYNKTGLVMLNISHTDFTHLKPYQFIGYNMLSILDVSLNNINTLPGNTFMGLSSLSRVMLIGNKLSKITPMTFNGLTAVRYLDLSNMRLSEVQLGSFNVMTKLTSLDLSGNPLKTLDVSVYSGGTLYSVNVTDIPLEYFYPPLAFDFPLTFISNVSYLCCFQERFKCCGSSLELSTCLNRLTDAVIIGSIIYGILIIGINVLTGVIIYQKMSSIQRIKDFGTLVVFVMDGSMGLYLVLVGLTRYLTPIGLVQRPGDIRHIACLFGAWLQQFLSLSTSGIKAKQAFDYMKRTRSVEMAVKGVRSQIVWFIMNLMLSIALTGLLFLPVPLQKPIFDVYPVCSILLVNHSRGGELQHISLAILVANILLGVMTIVFIVRVWLNIKSSRKAVEGFGAIVKTENLVTQLAPGIRMAVRSAVSILANIFGMCIYLLVDAATMGIVVIPLLLTLIFNSPSLISPLTYIITVATANIISKRKQK